MVIGEAYLVTALSVLVARAIAQHVGARKTRIRDERRNDRHSIPRDDEQNEQDAQAFP